MAEYIEKAALLEKLHTGMGVIEMTQTIFDEPAVELPQWIPVAERLPHAIGGESDDVLTLNRIGQYNLLYFDGKRWRKRNGELYTMNPQFEVIYWMLPGAPNEFKPWRREPPKEERNCDS